VVAKDTEDVLNPESAGHDPDTQQSGDGGQPTANGANNGPGYDMGGNASFAGMTYGGDFNQMQMMMAMQNGMMPNFNFPMMGMSIRRSAPRANARTYTFSEGMPNAGMDPMMQNMYMNGGFGSQGMGMNGMNMMGGGYGTTGSNWSGQQSWDIGQDNYNHPSAVGNGDYGSYNSGFHTGHNQQGNFGHQSSYGFQRGYGRGRGGRGRGYNGGYGRGGYNNFGPQGSYQDRNFTPQHYGNGHIDQASNQPLPPSTVSGNNEEPGGVDEFGRTTNLRRDSGSDQREDGEQGAAQKALGAPLSETGADLDGPIPAPGGEKTSGETPPGQGSGESSQAVADSTDAVTEAVASQSAEDVSATERGPGPSSSSGFAAQSRSEKGGSMPPPAVPSPDVPLNAPSGPKAMRQGLPNTSVVHLRARGFNVAGERGPRPAANDPAIPSPSFERGLRSRSSSRDRSKRQDTTRHRDRSRDPARAEEPARERDERREDKDHSRSGSRSSRSRSRDRKDSHRRRRHHSEPASESEREENGHHRSKHRSSRRLTAYDDEGEPKSARPRDEKHDERSRSASPEDSRRSGHRSRRDRDLDKRRDRERDKERGRDDQRSHRRRGSHRERDYDRDYDRDRERKDREKDKDRARDRHHERGHRHRGSKDTNEVPTSMDAPKDSKPPAGPRSNKALYSFEIKGASSRSRDGPQQPRRGSQASSSKAAPVAASPTGDPYQAEREKRQRERLVAEAQKLAGLQGIAGAKRGRDEGDDGRRNRRKGRRGDVVNMDEMGERLRRGEAERESFRAA